MHLLLEGKSENKFYSHLNVLNPDSLPNGICKVLWKDNKY